MRTLGMGELEASVMDVVWTDDGWWTPGQVHDALAGQHPVAYTTVMTILVRLWKKGRLDRRRAGRAFSYHPFQTRQEYTASRLRELLASSKDRAGALVGFVDALDAKERAQLRRMLGERRR